MKPVLEKRFEKMIVVGKGPDIIGKELLRHIHASELPRNYGGRAEGFGPVRDTPLLSRGSKIKQD